MAEEYSNYNILPGLDLKLNTSEIVSILNTIGKGKTIDYNAIAYAMESYRNSKYESACKNTSENKISGTDLAVSTLDSVTSSYDNVIETLEEYLSNSADNSSLNTVNSLVSSDLYNTAKTDTSLESVCEKYLGYIYADIENGYEQAQYPMQEETGGDSMLFCRQVLNDLGINWVSRYIDYALQEAKSASLLIEWPYSDFPKSLEAYRKIQYSKRKELERKSELLLTEQYINDTGLVRSGKFSDTDINPYRLEEGDIIISPDKTSAAIVISDMTIYQCANRTLLDCPYAAESGENKCAQYNTCFRRQFDFTDSNTITPKVYGLGNLKYDEDNPENTGGYKISNDPRNKCISTVYEYKNLCVVHDNEDIRKYFYPWYSYIIKTSELVKKIRNL